MSVQEQYAFAVSDPEQGLATASRLAELGRAELRWAATWTVGPPRSDVLDRFGSRSLPATRAAAAGVEVVCLPSPTMEEVRDLIAHAVEGSLCVHWSPPLYESERGPDAPWISFVGPDGMTREDARVYRIELSHGAIPLTTADRPWQRDFVFGPQPAAGWGLRVTAVRDHMPRGQLLARLAAAAGVPAGSVRGVSG